jgi:NADP-reducing hydrogenase subunit HndB
MDRIRSLKDLDKAREKALQKERTAAQKNRFQVCVSLGSCGIAVGAMDTYTALDHLINRKGAGGIRLKKTGCIGLCSLEPVIQVIETDRPPVTYGRVTPSVARQIFEEHIGKGLILQDHIVEKI